MVEFVSYDGKFPNLCSGTLVLKIDGIDRVFPEHSMSSGGSVSFDVDWCEHVCHGRWGVNVPDDLIDHKQEIEDCINENVPYGCCGGCV